MPRCFLSPACACAPRRVVARSTVIAEATVKVLSHDCVYARSSPLTSRCDQSQKPSAPLLLQLLPASLTCARKHWRQLDDFHSLTDLKIHVSSHKDPQITAGLRSVCWKVRDWALLIAFKLISSRYSSSSRPSTARHGQPTSSTRASPTSPFEHTTFVPSATLTSSSLP